MTPTDPLPLVNGKFNFFNPSLITIREEFEKQPHTAEQQIGKLMKIAKESNIKELSSRPR